MADVLLTLNGIGHGPLVRALQVSRWLRRAHRRPVIFFQGHYPQELSLRVPGVGIWALYELPSATAQLVATQVASYAALNGPAVVIEDTHPAPVSWSSDVTRFLVVRPGTFAFMSMLQARHGSELARFIVCDSPGSPSWPYSTAETEVIRSWPRWCNIGPLFRRPSGRSVKLVRDTYRIKTDEQVFVFTLGGGGERSGSHDRNHFIEHASSVAGQLRELWPHARLLFVCGPLFPHDLAIPPVFEVIQYEPELPSLLQVAHGAVIRPGFNVMWECIAAATRFMLLPGATFAEPVQNRLAQLQRHGIDISGSPGKWADSNWRDEFRSACRRVTARFSGNPAAEFMKALGDGLEEHGRPLGTNPPQTVPPHREAGAYEDLRVLLRAMAPPKRLLIRLDDVITGGSVLEWLIGACAERTLPLSLEVIPYFARLDGRTLDALDPHHICEVSQHGYAHIPHGSGGASGRGEFADQGPPPPGAAIPLPPRGWRLLTRSFGDRFKGGYSAPYDGWPAWMPSVWASLGGNYISWIVNPPAANHIRHVQLAVGVWDWGANAPKTPRAIVARSTEALRRRRSIGLVLHPQCLENPSSRTDTERLIDVLVDGGCKGEFVSRAANGARARDASL